MVLEIFKESSATSEYDILNDAVDDALLHNAFDPAFDKDFKPQKDHDNDHTQPGSHQQSASFTACIELTTLLCSYQCFDPSAPR